MKPAVLAVVLAVSSRWCGSGEATDVKAYAVDTVDGKSTLMLTAIYRANVSKQTVMWWVEGGPDGPMTLENCTVRDALNWRCERRGKREAVSGSVMVDGRYGSFGVIDLDGWKYLTESEWKALQAQQK
jgi:hypothetical protein